MGKGPKPGPAEEASRKPKLSDRISEAGESDDAVAPDPCREVRSIAIDRAGVSVSVGDAIRVIPGSPPAVANAAGVIGRVRGSEARGIETCMRVGVSFSGVVETVTPSTVEAVVQGS